MVEQEKASKESKEKAASLLKSVEELTRGYEKQKKTIDALREVLSGE